MNELMGGEFRLLRFFHKCTGIFTKKAHVYEEDQPSLSSLPDDVLCNIFMRLPAKRVARMRCVSKSWNILLSRPSSIKSHLDHSMHNNKDEEILMVFNDEFPFRNRPSRNKPFTVHRSRSPHHQLTSVIKLRVTVASLKHTSCHVIGSHISCHVIGSVNGLVCYINNAYPTHAVTIWNPSLSALLPLPPSNLIPKCSHVYTALFRFGYDPKTDDYKVVKLTGIDTGYSVSPYACIIYSKNWQKVEVYSMRKGSWESIPQSFPSHIKCIFNQNEVCTDGQNGHIHWLCYIDEGMTRERIVAFDLNMETFNEIPLPASIQHYDEHRSLVLGFMAGKLCLMSRFEDGVCEVWVMDEYRVAESWVIHHVFPQHVGIERPFGFTMNNEFLFEADDKSLALYDLVTAKVKSFEMIAPLGLWIINRTKVVPYVDSLVWVAPAKHGINVSSLAVEKKDYSEAG